MVDASLSLSFNIIPVQRWSACGTMSFSSSSTSFCPARTVARRPTRRNRARGRAGAPPAHRRREGSQDEAMRTKQLTAVTRGPSGEERGHLKIAWGTGSGAHVCVRCLTSLLRRASTCLKTFYNGSQTFLRTFKLLEKFAEHFKKTIKSLPESLKHF